MPGRTLSKEDLLRQVDTLRDIARRGRRLSEAMELESDRRRLMAQMVEIEQCAARVEKNAVQAKTFPIAPSLAQKKSSWLD